MIENQILRYVVYKPHLLLLFISQAYEEATKRLQMESEDRKNLVPILRKKARQNYLVKRREDKVEDLEHEIDEEMYYFGDQK